MAIPAAHRSSTAQIVFLSRDPVVHERSGSTTYIVSLLELLRSRGAEVTLVSTTAQSRSPRLFFRAIAPLPAGVHFVAPGYFRFGPLYVLPLKPKAWARALARVAARRPWLHPLTHLVEEFYGETLYTGAWDLTLPLPGEADLATAEAQRCRADTVIANYCIWGSFFAERRLGKARTAILMHDLLSTRVRRFLQNGTTLDMPAITEAEEMQWLSGAQTVLAAQPREADEVRTRVQSKVLVTPVLLRARALDPEAVVEGRCLFVGSNIAPNRTALEFLLEAVWPLVRAEVPGATLAVAGTVALALGEGERASASASLGVELLGPVPSLEEEYARAAVCLVPLLLGTGIKIKLLEALGFGKAIVSTSVGIEGLEAWAPGVVEVADDAETFATAIVRLLSHEDLRHSRERAALQLARDHFGPDRELDPAFAEALL